MVVHVITISHLLRFYQILFSTLCFIVCGGPCHYNVSPSTPLSNYFFDTVFHSVDDAMFHSVGNNSYESPRLFYFQLSFFFGIISLWCACRATCNYNVQPSTPLSNFFFDVVFHTFGDAMFHSVGNNRYASSRLFDFQLIFFWNNFDMMRLWWSMSLQCPTLYSHISSFFSTLCFTASVTLCFIGA